MRSSNRDAATADLGISVLLRQPPINWNDVMAFAMLSIRRLAARGGFHVRPTQNDTYDWTFSGRRVSVSTRVPYLPRVFSTTR